MTKDAEDWAIERALKYLDLARNEILEKVRFVNQTLGAYLLGVSSVVAWVYNKSTPATASSAHATPHSELAVGLAAVLAYLALGVNWIIHHNETMISALALYQKKDLGPTLTCNPKIWEVSETLSKRDGVIRSSMMIIVQQAIILGPPSGGLYFAFWKVSDLPSVLFWIRLGAVVGTAAAAFIGLLTLLDRLVLRLPRLHKWLCKLLAPLQERLKKFGKKVMGRISTQSHGCVTDENKP
jgi:hypothetical protein